MGVIGNIAGGYLSDRLSRKYGIKIGRRVLGVGGLAISAVLIFLGGFISGKIQVFIFMSLCFGIMDLMLPSAWAISGAMNTAGNLGGFVCATAFGYLVEATGSYNFPLYIIAGMLLVSAFLFLRINPEKQIITDQE